MIPKNLRRETREHPVLEEFARRAGIKLFDFLRPDEEKPKRTYRDPDPSQLFVTPHETIGQRIIKEYR